MIAILDNLKGWHEGRGSRHALWTSTNGWTCQAERFQLSVSWPLSNHLSHSKMKWVVSWGNKVPITEEVAGEGCGLFRILQRLSWRVRHLQVSCKQGQKPASSGQRNELLVCFPIIPAPQCVVLWGTSLLTFWFLVRKDAECQNSRMKESLRSWRESYKEDKTNNN